MQVNNRQNISFQGFHPTDEVKLMPSFAEAQGIFDKFSDKADVFVSKVTEPHKETGEPLEKFFVKMQTLSGDMSATAKTGNLTSNHLEKATQAAWDILTKKLFEHHSTKPKPPEPKLEVKVVPIGPGDLMNIMAHNRQN